MAEDRGKPPGRPGDIHIHQEQVDGGATGVEVNLHFHGAAEPPESEESGYRCMARRPEAFVPRHQLGKLVELLCQAAAQETEGVSVGITTALRGAGGFGKTTLAQQLCFEPEVRRAFPDGMLWVTMGEHVSEAARLGRVLDLLRGWSSAEPPAFTEVDAASAELRRRLAGERVLVVVDDVWQSVDLVPFQGLDAGAAVLVTTRDRRMLPRGSQEIQVDAMEADESVALLAAGLNGEGDHVGLLQPLAQRLGNWPLMLDLVNRHLCELVQRDGLTVPEAVGEVERLLDAEGLTAFDIDDDEARRTAVERTMAVSLRRLEDAERRHYKMLAVFPEDIDIPLAMLARYWSLAEGATRKLCERLHGLSLLERYDRRVRTVRLHDVFRQYLIDRQGDAMPALHGTWLDAFRPASGRWHDLPPDDAYTWRHLAYHLRHAGQGDKLRALLFDYAWLDAKLRAADVSALLADFAHLAPSLDEDAEARLVHDALRLSSHVLAEDADQLPSQLVGRLGHFGESHAGIGQLLAQAQILARTPWLCPVRPSLMAPGGPLERTLAGHSGWVRAVAVTPDGSRTISASRDNTLKVWDLEDGQLHHTLAGHSHWVRVVAVTPDGSRAISASDDCTLKVWDLEDGQLHHTLHGHSAPVTAVAVTPDGSRAISASEDHTLKVWDLEDGQLRHTLHGHRFWVRAVAVTPDGSHAISASEDHTLKVWDLEDGQLRHTLHGHSDTVWAVTVTPDGSRAISASHDNTLKVWDITSGRAIARFSGDAAMRCVAASEGDRIVAGDVLGRVHILRLIRESTSPPALSSQRFRTKPVSLGQSRLADLDNVADVLAWAEEDDRP